MLFKIYIRHMWHWIIRRYLIHLIYMISDTSYI